MGAVVVGLVTALIVVLSVGPAQAKPVLLQPTASSGPDPFTSSPTKTPPAATVAVTPSAPSSSSASGARVVAGSTVGLYGGTQNVSSCDVPQLIEFLTTHPDKGSAWAGVEGITQADIPAYLRSLTPVVLRADTRVTNHGFSNGAATSFQSVLQAGTAVLVDNRGVLRVRCACGNPLLPAQAQTSEAFTGPTWTTFKPTNVIIVAPAIVVVTVIVLYDPDKDSWFGRPTGSTGGGDHTVPPPASSPVTPAPATSTSTSTPSTSSSSSSSSGSAAPCISGSSVTSGASSSTSTSSSSTSTSTSSSSTSSSSSSSSSAPSPSSASGPTSESPGTSMSPSPCPSTSTPSSISSSSTSSSSTSSPSTSPSTPTSTSSPSGSSSTSSGQPSAGSTSPSP